MTPQIDWHLPIVGVMGSGTDPHPHLSAEVAEILVDLPAHLLTGGGRGVMSSVAECYVKHPRRITGLSIGIIPCLPNNPTKPKAGYPNPFVEIPIFTHLPLSGDRGTELGSRNHINILTPSAIVTLPGSHGTLSEMELAIQYRKPLVTYAHDPESVAHFPEEVRRFDNPTALKIYLQSVCHPVTP